MKKVMFFAFTLAALCICGSCEEKVPNEPTPPQGEQPTPPNNEDEPSKGLPEVCSLNMEDNNYEVLRAWIDKQSKIQDELFIDILGGSRLVIVDEYMTDNDSNWHKYTDWAGTPALGSIYFFEEGTYRTLASPGCVWGDMDYYMCTQGYNGWYNILNWSYDAATDTLTTSDNSGSDAKTIAVRYLQDNYCILEGRIKEHSPTNNLYIYVCRFEPGDEQTPEGYITFDEYKAIWEQYCEDNGLNNENHEYYWW